MKLNSVQRAKEIERAMKLAWDSAQSHLYYTHSGQQIRSESHQFHRRCVRDYVEIIHILAKLY